MGAHPDHKKDDVCSRYQFPCFRIGARVSSMGIGVATVTFDEGNVMYSFVLLLFMTIFACRSGTLLCLMQLTRGTSIL